MTLQQFLEQHQLRNAHVSHPDFSTLYVRYASHVVRGELQETFDIASVRAAKPGNGAFERLLNSLSDLNKPIYVESVLNARFASWLLRNGFEATNIVDCYVKFPQSQGMESRNGS